MLSLANVMHLLTNKFSRLGGGGLSLAPIASGPLHSLFFRHNNYIQWLAACREVLVRREVLPILDRLGDWLDRNSSSASSQ